MKLVIMILMAELKLSRELRNYESQMLGGGMLQGEKTGEKGSGAVSISAAKSRTEKHKDCPQQAATVRERVTHEFAHLPPAAFSLPPLESF